MRINEIGPLGDLAKVTYEWDGEAQSLTGVLRAFVQEDDIYFWEPGDSGKPRLWLTSVFDHFIPVDDVLTIERV